MSPVPKTGSREGQIHVFGIRHLSPAGASHLRRLLDEVKPLAVLVEGPADATGLIPDLLRPGVKPPVAILAYTDQVPVRTLLFPFASYSPEYQALLWAAEHDARAEFIDLPTTASVPLYAMRPGPYADEPGEEAGGGESEEFGEAPEGKRRMFHRRGQTLYQRVAELAGEPDYESYWERHFEHQSGREGYRVAVARFSSEMRGLLQEEEREADPHEASVNTLREAYMRSRIRRVIDDGIPPERIVVVTGAYHVTGLTPELPPLSGEEDALLPHTRTKLTLMPYSYYKLSSHSGYGAGNPAPAYFEQMWQQLQREDLRGLPALYLAGVAGRLREAGTYRSTAAVIEAVRLAEALASLRGAAQPTWSELRDAAVVSFGYGELAPVAEALAHADIGTRIGELPEGVSQTPVQDDMNRHLKRLKLEKYKSAVAADLELDLRENRRVKTEEAAYLDLHRSTFLHRLRLLEIPFAQKQRVRQNAATWAEHWVLQWTPEAEIRAVEATLKGETVELACAFELAERLQGCTDLAEASELIQAACECGLPEAMEAGRVTLQGLAADAGSFAPVAAAAAKLSVIIGYGDLRRVRTGTLEPLLSQLFLRGTLLLNDAALCSEEASGGILNAMNAMHRISQDHHGLVDDGQWTAKLQELASRDDRNAKLSGFAFGILLERSLVTAEQCSREVSRRLSPGIPADLGAGWFEGLSMRNRYALLSRTDLWQQLDEYIASLEPEPFRRSLVFLRRAFGSFERSEKAAAAELLGMLWGTEGGEAPEALQEPLTEEERGKIDELNDFDFGDL
ncbi:MULTISPECIES: DUF5682 family protein [Paenibacillus]|uniref:DUF5682 family protein n=1 Tax=Paenibacillus TaxID=44249 RepID=UPI0022B89728|nr:DUF5682 family protein [Paenibacillus caseinilyticus]MCZ8520375.1 DUF5682 family protein [Paenibacillus caseinilyticus]